MNKPISTHTGLNNIWNRDLTVDLTFPLDLHFSSHRFPYCWELKTWKKHFHCSMHGWRCYLLTNNGDDGEASLGSSALCNSLFREERTWSNYLSGLQPLGRLTSTVPVTVSCSNILDMTSKLSNILRRQMVKVQITSLKDIDVLPYQPYFI